MTDPNSCAIAIVLDRSGSMDLIKSDAQGALNEFVKNQKELPGKATLTLVQFDSLVELVHLNKPLAEVGEIVLHPRGSTALLDATGFTISKLGEELAFLPEDQRPGKVLVAIVTDGRENASREWTYESVKNAIDEQKNKWNWEFIYLAADEKSVAEAAKIGIDSRRFKSYSPTPAGVRAGGQSMASYAASYRSTGRGTFDDAEDDKNK